MAFISSFKEQVTLEISHFFLSLPQLSLCPLTIFQEKALLLILSFLNDQALS